MAWKRRQALCVSMSKRDDNNPNNRRRLKQREGRGKLSSTKLCRGNLDRHEKGDKGGGGKASVRRSIGHEIRFKRGGVKSCL